MFDEVPGGAAGGFVGKDGVFYLRTEMGLLRTGTWIRHMARVRRLDILL